MATLQELEYALVNAHRAGDTDAARKLAAVINRARQDKANLIPGTQVPETMASPAPTLGEQAIGALETGATLVTGATSGAVGMVGGTAKGLAKSILSGEFGTPQAQRMVERSAMEGASALTYAPRTETGREMAAGAGEALANLIPAAPLAAELSAVPGMARMAAVPAEQAARRAAAPVARAMQPVVEKLRPPTTSAVTEGSVGAAAVDAANLRRLNAEELGFTGEAALTRSQATRDFGDVRTERELAKVPEVGEPLRERFANQRQRTEQVLDNWIDEAGSQTFDLRGVGVAVDEALKTRAKRDKTKIRTLYKDAEKAGEMTQPVTLAGLIDHLNQSSSLEGTVPSLAAIRREAVRLGAASEDGGVLQPSPIPLREAELLRQFIGDATDTMDSRQTRQAAITKGLLDADTEAAGGTAYRKARSARRQYAKDYEDFTLAAQLLGSKRGSSDRAVALEHVLNKSVLEPSTSLDSMRKLRRLLQTEGEQGKQAWREIQGGVLRHIKDQALTSATLDERGSRIFSPSQLDRVITQLDRAGKLDYIFGKQGAEKLRLMNEVAQTIMTVPPGTVNTSNTATVLAGLMDVALSGTSGVPAPAITSWRFMSKHIKDAKLRKQVSQALGDTK